MVGLPRRPRNVSPIIQALLAQSQQQLPNRSGPLNVVGKALLSLSAARKEKRRRKREEEEEQAEKASTRKDVNQLIEALLPTQKPGVPSPLDPEGEVREFDRDAIRKRAAIRGISDPGIAATALEGVLKQRTPKQPANEQFRQVTVDKGKKGERQATVIFRPDAGAGQASFLEEDAAGNRTAVASNRISSPITRQQTQDVSFEDRTPAELKDDRAFLDEADEMFGLTESSMLLTSEHPSASGIRGKGSEILQKTLGQAFPGFTADIVKGLTDVSPQMLSRIFARKRVLISRNMSNISGEESGRYTEQERAIAEDVLQGINALTEPDLILGAEAAMIEIILAGEARVQARNKQPFRFDLSVDEGKIRFMDFLRARGLEDDVIFDMARYVGAAQGATIQ